MKKPFPFDFSKPFTDINSLICMIQCEPIGIARIAQL